MLNRLVRAFAGDPNARALRRFHPVVEQINALEPEFEALDDAALAARSDLLREKIAAGTPLVELRGEAFAAVREAGKRALGLRLFDVQLLGALILFDGAIAEMKTGEGKTLTATAPLYLHALSGKGAHLITVNDYLAKRDAADMGRLFAQLGLSTGSVVPGISDSERRAAYACDITYITNNEIGFDYLRDNMRNRLEDTVQRPFHYAIIDEADSVLIDEARTPLMISGQPRDSSQLYRALNSIVPAIPETAFDIDEKSRSVQLSDSGIAVVEDLLVKIKAIQPGSNLYDSANVHYLSHVLWSLRAHHILRRDTDYMVNGGQIVLIDPYSGRAMPGRRMADGFQQAVEAKEGLTISPENNTVATLTYQNLFRQYPRLSGMTGTAATEAEEFESIYSLGVVEVPTHLPVRREDHNDDIYRSDEEKQSAILDQITACHEKRQPVLVGTTSLEKSERLAAALKKRKISHQILNAKHHEQEAEIIAQAGRPGQITIATNMAGRGTDIQLGGNPDVAIEVETRGLEDSAEIARITAEINARVAREKAEVIEAGGLFVLGTERHESRRIDNQLRGRSGRQGDPGESKFFLSLHDDLMRIFGGRLESILNTLRLPEGEAISAGPVTRAIEGAQRKVEGRNFDARKSLLRYDDVLNDQRKLIYQQRQEILEAETVDDFIDDMRSQAIDELVARYLQANQSGAQWNSQGLAEEVQRLFGLELPIADWVNAPEVDEEAIASRIDEALIAFLDEKAAQFDPDQWARVEREVLILNLDHQWQAHLQQLLSLRDGIGLRAIGQRNPLYEYRQEAFGLFEGMFERARIGLASMLARAQVRPLEAQDSDAAPPPPVAGEDSGPQLDPNRPETWGKVGRNAPCPCGSGKKYKHCHGALQR
jgi:preprotein translocase subunit SecA